MMDGSLKGRILALLRPACLLTENTRNIKNDSRVLTARASRIVVLVKLMVSHPILESDKSNEMFSLRFIPGVNTLNNRLS